MRSPPLPIGRPTAEGAETPDQLQRLRDEGCTGVQGFLLGKPAPAEAAGRLAKGVGTATAAA
jgi:EAL domain-containing protein (putative c-di-GMP-specific phosphodiesterase class I)